MENFGFHWLNKKCIHVLACAGAKDTKSGEPVKTIFTVLGDVWWIFSEIEVSGTSGRRTSISAASKTVTFYLIQSDFAIFLSRNSVHFFLKNPSEDTKY